MTDPPSEIVVDCAAPTGSPERIWASFGYDELNWTATPRGRKNLARLRDVLGERAVVRAHPIFTSGNGRAVPHWSSGNVYHEDAAGDPYHDFRIVDEAFDAWTHEGMRPLVELGFCPFAPTRDLPGPEFLPMPSLYGPYASPLWASPPKDFQRWATWSPPPSGTSPNATAWPRRPTGTGSCGTSPTSCPGRARSRSTASATT